MSMFINYRLDISISVFAPSVANIYQIYKLPVLECFVIWSHKNIFLDRSYLLWLIRKHTKTGNAYFLLVETFYATVHNAFLKNLANWNKTNLCCQLITELVLFICTSLYAHLCNPYSWGWLSDLNQSNNPNVSEVPSELLNWPV